MDVGSVKRIHQSDWRNEGIRFLRARDIVSLQKKIEIKEMLFIDKNKYEEYSKISGKVMKGDLLVTGVGSIGVPMLINSSDPIYFKDGNIIWFKNNNSLDGYFFYYSFLSNKIQSFIRESAGIGTVGTYTIENGKKTPIFFPIYRDEQKRIGEFFEKIDKLITLHQRKLEQLEQLKNTLLSKMFPKSGTNIPEIRFSGFTDAWKQRKLGSVGTTYTGLSGKTADDFGHGDAHFITYINVFSNPIVNPYLVDSVEIDNKQHEVKIGDVFFTTSSETPGEVGMSSVLKEKHGITYLNSFCFGFRPNVKFDLDYLAYMLRSKHTRKQITLLAQGISRFNISKNKMMDINIYVPTIDEQAKIGACFYSVNKHITIHQRQLEQLKNLKQTLLNKMFI